MRTAALALLVAVSPAMAQNSFQTPGSAVVPGIVTMCIVGNLAVPCTHSTATTTVPTAALDHILAELDALRAEVLRLKTCGTAGAVPC